MKDFQHENNKLCLNETCEVLVENKTKNGLGFFGRTQFMTPVFFESNNCKPGQLANVQITSYNGNSLFGEYKIKN